MFSCVGSTESVRSVFSCAGSTESVRVCSVLPGVLSLSVCVQLCAEYCVCPCVFSCAGSTESVRAALCSVVSGVLSVSVLCSVVPEVLSLSVCVQLCRKY